MKIGWVRTKHIAKDGTDLTTWFVGLDRDLSDRLVVVVGVDDLNFANRFGSPEVTEAAGDTVHHGTDGASDSFIPPAKLPPNQHVAADRHEMVLMPRTLILGSRVGFFVLLE